MLLLQLHLRGYVNQMKPQEAQELGAPLKSQWLIKKWILSGQLSRTPLSSRNKSRRDRISCPKSTNRMDRIGGAKEWCIMVLWVYAGSREMHMVKTKGSSPKLNKLCHGQKSLYWGWSSYL